MRTTYLAEETRFVLLADEDITAEYSPFDKPNWGADPMEILMAKQERERLELEAEMSQHH